MLIRKEYDDIFWVVDYTYCKEDHPGLIEFECFEIHGGDIDTRSSIKGSIKFDGCVNFTHDDHYCGIHRAEQVLELFKEIYKYAEKTFGTNWCGW